MGLKYHYRCPHRREVEGNVIHPEEMAMWRGNLRLERDNHRRGCREPPGAGRGTGHLLLQDLTGAGSGGGVGQPCQHLGFGLVLLPHSCPTLCDPIDSSPPGSSVPGILQARILEWVAISFSNAWHAKSLQSCPTLCNPMDSSPPGSSVHGIFQTRIHSDTDFGVLIVLSHPDL